MALQAVLLSAAVGRGFQLNIGTGNTLAISIALVLMGLDFGLDFAFLIAVGLGALLAAYLTFAPADLN